MLTVWTAMSTSLERQGTAFPSESAFRLRTPSAQLLIDRLLNQPVESLVVWPVDLAVGRQDVSNPFSASVP